MGYREYVNELSKFCSLYFPVLGGGRGGVLKTLVLLKTKSKETEETTKAQSA